MSAGEPSRAPVALFAHRRRDHLERVVAALQANAGASDTPLVVFVDGPRTPDEAAQVAQVREFVGRIDGFASVDVIAREHNLGLAQSITTGVAQTLDRWGTVIVLEDDTVVGPHFLDYMNDGLRVYADDERVASIHGYVYPMDVDLPDTFFMRGGDCWGWATWSRAWAHFDADGSRLRERLRASGAMDEWDFDGWSGLAPMLDGQIAGDVDSWAVRWSAATFLDGMYTLYPGRSLVHNIGNDGSGSHGGDSSRFDVEPYAGRVDVRPIEVVEDPAIHAAFEAFYRSQSADLSLGGRLTRWVRRARRGR